MRITVEVLLVLAAIGVLIGLAWEGWRAWRGWPSSDDVRRENAMRVGTEWFAAERRAIAWEAVARNLAMAMEVNEGEGRAVLERQMAAHGLVQPPRL